MKCKIGISQLFLREVTVMFAKELSHDGHTKRFTVSPASERGWEVRVEQDSQVVRRVCYTDWHRVERAVTLFSLQVSQLAREGWRVSTS